MDRRALAVLAKEQLIELYRHLQRSRTVEERIAMLFRQGLVPGAVFNGIGQEAVTVGACYAMAPEDVIANTHRDAGGVLVRGLELEFFLRQWLGKADGIMRGRDGNMHWGIPHRGFLGLISHVGAGPGVATGAALSFKLRGEKRCAVTPLGDGATSTGYVHEAMNFAAVHKLPVLYVCLNNQYAMSTPNSKQFAAPLVDRARGYGIPGYSVDGNDVLAVYWHTREALDRARAGEGPTFLECVTMRMRGHSEADNAQYVPKTLIAEWKQKDPINCYAALLKEVDVLGEAERAIVDEAVAAEVDAAIEAARQGTDPTRESLLAGGVYSQPVGGGQRG